MAKPYGQKITRDKRVAGSQYGPGGAVMDHSLSGAVEELYRQHPHDEHDEGVQHQRGPVTKPGRGKAVI